LKKQKFSSKISQKDFHKTLQKIFLKKFSILFFSFSTKGSGLTNLLDEFAKKTSAKSGKISTLGRRVWGKGNLKTLKKSFGQY